MDEQVFTLINDRLGQLHTDMQRGFGGINSRLDVQNGRTRELEILTAKQAVDLSILQERHIPKKPAIVWGTISGSAVIGIVEAIRAYLK